MTDSIDIVFDGPPDHNAPRFVEVESPPGTSIKFGEWIKRDDGLWALRFSPVSDRDAIIEECAKVADQFPNANKIIGEGSTACRLETYSTVAKAIRALKDKK